MTKKILIGLAPLLAVAAFAVMPAMASAATKEYGTCAKGTPETKPPCKKGEHFTAFKEGEKVKVVDKKVSATFVLEEEAAEPKAGITCSTFSSKGEVENKGGVGKSVDTLTYDDCVGTGELAACEINPPSHEITGVVDDLVLSETEVEIKIVSGFNVKCGTTELGDVEGTAKGKVSGSDLTFTKATGLKFLGKGSTITGESSTETESTKLPVFIN